MNKVNMLVKRIKELEDKEKRNLVWSSFNEETKNAVKSLINYMGIKSNE